MARRGERVESAGVCSRWPCAFSFSRLANSMPTSPSFYRRSVLQDRVSINEGDLFRVKMPRLA